MRSFGMIRQTSMITIKHGNVMNKLDFESTIRNIQEANSKRILPVRIVIRVPNARQELKNCLARLVHSAQWLAEYDEVVHWLEDNHGRGLLCVGNCGRGKTMLCYRVIPILLNFYLKKSVCCYDAVDINSQIDEMKNKGIVCVDDIGTESDYFVYGVRRQPFAELVDNAEKTGKLLLLTTNLTTDQLRDKYGIRVFDRLKRITKLVHFKGSSLR